MPVLQEDNISPIHAICSGLGLPWKETDTLIPVNSSDVLRCCIGFFATKRAIKPKTYKDLPIDEIIYRLQKRYPEFCLLCYWFDNRISEQQTNLIDTNGLDWTYSPLDIMQAYWATGFCGKKREVRGPIWPILGYTKELYQQLGSDDSVLKSQIDNIVYSYGDWETLWGSEIEFESANDVVTYALKFVELISMTAYAWGLNDFENFISYWLWHWKPVEFWSQQLLKSVKTGQGITTVYYALKRYLGHRHPGLFSYLEQDKYFKIAFSDEPSWKKGILLQAFNNDRKLTPIELDLLNHSDGPPDTLNQLKKVKQTSVINVLATCVLPDDMRQLNPYLESIGATEILKQLIEAEFWNTSFWQNMHEIEHLLTSADLAELYIGNHSDDLVERKLKGFSKLISYDADSISDSWTTFVDVNDKKRFGLYRKWLSCLNRKPILNNRLWGFF